MKSWYALVQREFLEHRGAFVYAPAALVAVLLGAILLAFASSQFQVVRDGFSPEPLMLYEGLYLAVVKVWTSYLMIGLFFYFADAFSADRKSNALLFWKSMPQSDLKILASKILAGATIFPLLILGWMLVSSAVAYLATMLVAARIPEIEAPGLAEALGAWVQITAAGLVYIVLNLLWYAPIFGWVAALSTAFRGWSIPLAVVIPALAIAVETVLTYSGGQPASVIGDFLSWRLSPFYEDDQAVALLFRGGPINASTMISDMLAGIDPLGLLGGLLFVAAATLAASEYRRRRIDA